MYFIRSLKYLYLLAKLPVRCNRKKAIKSISISLLPNYNVLSSVVLLSASIHPLPTPTLQSTPSQTTIRGNRKRWLFLPETEARFLDCSARSPMNRPDRAAHGRNRAAKQLTSFYPRLLLSCLVHIQVSTVYKRERGQTKKYQTKT